LLCARPGGGIVSRRLALQPTLRHRSIFGTPLHRRRTPQRPAVMTQQLRDLPQAPRQVNREVVAGDSVVRIPSLFRCGRSTALFEVSFWASALCRGTIAGGWQKLGTDPNITPPWSPWPRQLAPRMQNRDADQVHGILSPARPGILPSPWRCSPGSGYQFRRLRRRALKRVPGDPQPFPVSCRDLR
jgi:hypothetical protein